MPTANSILKVYEGGQWVPAVVGARGPQGNQGAQGFQGSAGPQGFQGFQGVQGDTGPQGFQGFQGVQGAIGIQGAQGFQGRQGVQGVIGVQGVQGVQGAIGVQGAQGFQGVQGVQGALGNQGFQGFQGIQGIAGDKYASTTTDSLTVSASGFKLFNVASGLAYSTSQIVRIANTELIYMEGSVVTYTSSNGNMNVSISSSSGSGTYSSWQVNLGGAPGPSGAQGFQGFQGVQGSTGIQGAQGVQGAVGIQGAQGVQGVIGVQGAQGFQGRQGVQGVIGVQGAQGVQGAVGIQGAQGVQGAVGIQGAQGVQGAVGIQGAQGVQGVIGIQGSQGFQGRQGVQGAVGIQGAQGVQGAIGIQGSQGFQGTQGVQGAPGAGSVGGSNTHIQFNDNGTFGGSANLVFHKANSTVGIGISNPLARLHARGSLGFPNTDTGILVSSNVSSDNDSTINYFKTFANVDSGLFLTELNHFIATEDSFNTSEVVYQYGFYALGLDQGVENYGFYSQINSGPDNWNFYATTTANNYFAGSLGVGFGSDTELNTYRLKVGGKTLLNDDVIINSAGTGNALRITQTGTGNAFVVEDSTNPDATPFIITATGNVGIGITTPTTTLDVSGNVRLFGIGPVLLTLEADTDNVTESDNPRIVFKQDGGAVPARIGFATSTNSFEVFNEAVGYLSFGTTNAERMRIDSSGNVGIGFGAVIESTQFSYKLDVVGDTRTTGNVVATGSVKGIMFENDKILSQSYTLTSNKNGLTVGPVTVADGVTISVANNSDWFIM